MEPKEIAKYYEEGSLGSFSTSLMDLFAKADNENKNRLEKAFPEYAGAFYLWYYKPKGWDIIKDKK